MSRDSGGGSSPFGWLAAGAAVIIALAVVIIGVLWIAPDSIGRIRGQGELGVGILVALGVGGYTLAILALDAVGDAMAAMGAAAGLSLRKKKAEADHAEASADATRAASWTPGVPANGEVHSNGEYTGRTW